MREELSEAEDLGALPNDKAKRSVSLRVNASDHTKIKAIARRLRVRESDVFRFALRLALAKLAPLHDANVKGAGLMSVFADCGTEIAGYFNLDARQLDRIINQGVDNGGRQVSGEDVELLAMSAMPDRYLSVRLKELANVDVRPLAAAEFVRRYLNDKYLTGGAAEDPRDGG